MFKKSVTRQGGAAEGRLGSVIIIRYRTGRTITVLGERSWPVAGMVSDGREGTSMNHQGNLWAW